MAKQLTADQFEGYEDRIAIQPDEVSLDPNNAEKNESGSREHLLGLQLQMATTSVNHEYARMEFDETGDYERKEELMNYMTECRQKYDEARDELSCWNPLILEDFENDLKFQKMTTLKHYHA